MAPAARPTFAVSDSASAGLVARVDEVDGADRVVAGMAGMSARADRLACLVAALRACTDLVGAGAGGVGTTVCGVAG